MDIPEIQQFLAQHELDGWLMADFHGRNEIAMKMLKLKGIITRRSFYYIPALGTPVALVHNIEKDKFENVPGEFITYSSYAVLEDKLSRLLSDSRKVAMEYSARGRLPYIGLVDAGTVEFIRGLGVDVVSSADLVAYFQARLSAGQIARHRQAAANAMSIKDEVFAFVADRLKKDKTITEYDICRFILRKFDELNMETHDSPICGVDANAGNPHYEPTAERSATVRKGQLLLVDLWGKMKHPDGVFADITWMAYTGRKNEIPDKYRTLFDTVMRARDAAVTFLEENAGKGPVYGCDVDDVCRKVIAEAGYGENFTHRTGHSITSAAHGTGPNIDNLETEDKRQLQSGHLFSIEPGIYLPDCGFRSEINVLFGSDGCEITTLPLQTEIIALF